MSFYGMLLVDIATAITLEKLSRSGDLQVKFGRGWLFGAKESHGLWRFQSLNLHRCGSRQQTH